MALGASFANRTNPADATFGGRYAAACGERDWYVALLDHPHYVLAMFAHYWKDVGGNFAGGVRGGRVPPGAEPIPTLRSPPPYDAGRDINKLSNNRMAPQSFLTPAT